MIIPKSILDTVLVPLLVLPAWGATTVAFWDFTKSTHGWVANSMVSDAHTTSEGWVMDVKAPDPYLTGPPMDWPAGQFGRVTLRMRSDSDALGQV